MRVWDRFLTERDRAHGAKLGARLAGASRVGFGQRAALLMIDHCNYGLGDARVPILESMDRFPLSFGLEGWGAVEQTRRLLDACRDVGVPVLYTAPFGHGPHSPLRAPGGVGDVLADDRLGEIVAMLAPADDDVVLHKVGASGFAGTPLDAILHQLDVDTLLVTGNSTSGCVRATVVDAAYLRYRTIVVEECVYDRIEAAHAMSLFDMDQKYADVVGIDEVLDWLASHRAGVRGGDRGRCGRS